jgi:hypothetical protein
MKKSIYILLISTLIITSCTEDFLDVENKNSMTVENWYETDEDFQMALNSCYISLMMRGTFGLRHYFHHSTWSDRIIFETPNVDRLITNASDTDVDEVWDAHYVGIYRTSKLLEQLQLKGVDGIKGMTEESYNYKAAQARAIRAMNYFWLTVKFDQPILYNENDVPKDLLAPRGNPDRIDLWNQIEEDLEFAVQHLKLKSEISSNWTGVITRGGAMALLGKALLYKHYYYYAREGVAGSAEDLADLEKAGQLFKNVIASGEYELIHPKSPKTRKDYIYALLSNFSFIDLPSENNVYKSENNSESVWEVQFADYKALDDRLWQPGHHGPGALNAQWFSPHTSSFRNWEANPSMYYAFETEGAPAPFDRDPRCYASLYFDGDTMDINPNSPYYAPYTYRVNNKGIASSRGLTIPEGTKGLGVKKYYFPVYWDGPYAPFNEPNNRRLIRYADVLLMYSEVMLLLGDDGSGLNALNQVRSRVDMPEKEVLTKDAIMHERDVELAFEGHRWFDLVRWSFSPEWNIDWNEIDWGINSLNSVNPFVVNKNEFYPIPQFEIDYNQGLLKQNPGW